MDTLGSVVQRSYILCYKENVDQVFDTLRAEGLNPSVSRATYTEAEQQYAKNTRTFMNHASVWKLAAEQPGYTLICESDFVPCKSLAAKPTFWPLTNPMAWGYLYQGSPRLLALVSDEQFLRGHCAPLVAYVINRDVAKILLRYFEFEMNEYDPKSYFTFDAHLQWWLMGQGAEAYIPLKHFGEHGGLPNAEHKTFGRLSRAGRHRADNLAGPLAFLPQYAEGSRRRFALERLEARALGWARLFWGRWVQVTNAYDLTKADKLRMYAVGLQRLLP